jgi:threonine dehydratase
VLKTQRADLRVVGVQSDKTSAMYDAFQAGRLVDSPIPPTLADGLSGCTDQISFERARVVVDELQLVNDSALGAAIAQLYRRDGIVAEGAGITPVAAIVERVVVAHGPTVLIISGGNIDAHKLSSILGD